MSTRFGTPSRALLSLLLLLALCVQPVLAGPAAGPQDGEYASPPPEDVAASAGAAGGGCFDLEVNGSFETADFTGWTTSGSPTIIGNGGASGWYSAGLGGRNNASDSIAQSVTCPFACSGWSVQYAVYISPTAPAPTAEDYLEVTVLCGSSPAVRRVYSAPFDHSNVWIRVADGLSEETCADCQLTFHAVTNSIDPTWFLVDAVRFTRCCPSDFYESNDTFRSARAVSPGIFNLRLCPSGDEDWFSFEATAGQLIQLWMQTMEAGQATVCLVAPDGTEVGCSTSVYPGATIVVETATTSGSWRARVYDPGYLTGGTQLRLVITLGDLPTPTASPTLPSATPTRTGVPTLTRTHTASPTRTGVATLTNTHTRTSTPTRTAVATLTRTSTRTPTRTATRTAVATPTRTGVAAPTRTATRTRTRTPWPTPYGGPKRLSLPLLLRRH